MQSIQQESVQRELSKKDRATAAFECRHLFAGVEFPFRPGLGNVWKKLN